VRSFHEKKITRRQEAFIALLLQHTSVTKAAEAANVPASTAWRWLNSSPEFNAAYRSARRKLTENATRVFQSAAAACAAKLVRMALDVTLSPSIQFAAASRVLELAYRGEEIEDLQAEIAELRELIEAVPGSKPKGKWKQLCA
jgi:Helix-turn-helix domain of transposase family ISL3